MKKRKQLMIGLAALTSTLLPYTVNAETTLSPKYEKLYDLMTKNIDKGTSDESGIKILEKILKQRNKELKDLYQQGDYIVKPEYLEWQVFATGFYNEYGKGRDNTPENAKYYSDVTGYFDANGNYIVTSGRKNGISGKTYQPLQIAKNIDLGVNIPLKQINKEPIVLNLTPAPEINVIPSLISLNVNVPQVSFLDLIAIEIPAVPLPPTGLTSTGIVIDPNIIEVTTPLVPAGSDIIFFPGTYNINATDDGLYRFNASNQKLIFDSGNIIINQSVGGSIASNYNLTGQSIENKSEMEVNISGNLLMGGFHSQNNFDGYFAFNNNGSININYDNTTDSQNLFFYGNILLNNIGDINLENKGSGIKVLYSTWNSNGGDNNPLYINNTGTITVKGDSNIAFNKTVMAHHYGHMTSTLNGQHTIINTGIINIDNAIGMLQDWSTGIYDASGGGVMNVKNQGVGIEITLTGFAETIFDKSTLNLGTMNIDGTGNPISAYSKAVNIIPNGLLTLTVDIESGTIILDKNSMGIITSLPGNQTIKNSADININGANSYGIITYDGGGGKATVENLGTIKLNTTNTTELAAGIFHQTSNLFTNKGDIEVTSSGTNIKGTIGVILPNGANFLNDGGNTKTITVDGGRATGLFANNNTTNTIKDTIVKVTNNGIGFFSYNGSDIKLDNIKAEASSGGILFYSSSTPSNSTITFSTPSTANIKQGGFAFFVDGSLSSITSSYLNLNNLSLKMEDNSTVFLLNTPGTFSIGSLPTATSVGLIIDPASGNYKDVTIYRGTINIDNIGGNQIFDLDISNDALNMNKFYSSNLNLVSGSTIKGTLNNQTALAQASYLGSINNTDITLTNDGIIALGGMNSVGMFSNFGTLFNNGNISISGDNGIALFGGNGTQAINTSTGTINIGNSGIGIYGVSYENPSSTPAYGSGKIDITNSGLIQAITSTEAIGIYANNNKIGGLRANASINLSTGTIDVSNSDKGVGVYINNGTLTDTASTITVGKNGLAIYAKDSDINLAGSTIINLNGDNATGVYLDGTSTVNPAAALTFNINGKNTVLFNLNFSTPTIINAGFTVNSITPGSNYLGGNLTNAHIKYTGNATLNSNSVFFNAVTSEVLVNSGASITSTAGAINVAGIIVDGYSNAPIGSWVGVPGFNGENQGTISLGDKSIGIFGKNGAQILNTGTITVGNESVGLKSDTTKGRIYNRGIINIGYKSQGMYLKNGDFISGQPDIYNESTGKILSSSAEAVGMFADDVDITQNDGLINLSGDQSVGIYIVGINPKDTINNGNIIMGNSSNVNAPSIGIYSTTAGERIINNGNISVGSKSIGIYADNSPVNNNGSLSIGDEGIGVYSTGGTVNLNPGSSLNYGTKDSIGVYGVGSTINNTINHILNDNNYGFILEGGTFNNILGTTSTLGTNSVFLYSTQAANITNDGNIILTGDDNIAFYTAADSVKGVGGANVLNTGIINGTTGKNNIGIYNYGGSVSNTGTISVGDSGLVLLTQSNGDVVVDVANSKYAVGIYGENSAISNSGSVSAGYGGVGIVANKGSAVNTGTITTNGAYSMGMYTEEGVLTNASSGTITVSGDNAIGMTGKGTGSHLINNGIINVTGTAATAMYGSYDTVITNTGVINISGTGATAFVSPDALDSRHSISGLINGTTGNNSYIHQSGGVHTLPTLINAGIIKTNGVLALDGLQVLVKPNPNTITASSNPDYDFELSGTSIIADHITTSNPIVILPGFADGTIADVYKLSGVIQASSGKYDFLSGSLLWEATPNQTSKGVDIYMSRKSFDSFSSGLWFDDFGKALDAEFLNARGNEKATKIYNNTAYIKNEANFRHIMASLAGNVYSNINQREKDISDTFENSLHILQNSDNNTKENVKISVIGGKGKNKEETDGVVGYDYTTTGVLALREVERTYKHTFGYSLGYLHTGFEFKDGNESEEWVDTIQLGVHNKYKINGWQLRNDLTGQVSIHNIDRNLDWPSPIGRSELNGHYETYSITSDNLLGKEFNLGKSTSVMPYGGIKAMYVTRPSFEEKGLEALKVEGNDAWSVKPRAGIELNTFIPIGQSAWQLKGTLDFAYEYELANLNEREKAKLINVEEGYHKLSKPEKEKGTFITKASVGVEVIERYGFYLTGEYSVGEHKEDDYRAGVNLKAVF